MRRLLHTILQALIDAEAAEHIGADPHERTDARTTYRNGTRDKTVSTTSGDLTVKIGRIPVNVATPSVSGGCGGASLGTGSASSSRRWGNG